MEKRKKIISDIIFVVILLLIIFFGYKLYSKYNFNEYSKAEYSRNGSQFLRDKDVKYSDMNSYKIVSNKDFNDAMFYQTIEVMPNTAYKVSCMVKTQDVRTKNENTDAGASIGIMDSVEKSKSITGTEDWKKIELLFDSNSRKTIKVGFRLGGNEDECTGVAWFSDFKIEVGTKDNDNKWKFGLFIIKNIDVNIENNGKRENIKLSMTDNDISTMYSNMERFNTSIRSMSNYQIEPQSYVYEVNESLTSISKDEENGYYISPKDVENLIDKYVEEQGFDHIFVAIRLGDNISSKEVPVNDWIGLRSHGILWDRLFQYTTS